MKIENDLTEQRQLFSQKMEELSEKLDQQIEKSRTFQEKLDQQAEQSRTFQEEIRPLLRDVRITEIEIEKRLIKTEYHLANWEENWQREHLCKARPVNTTNYLQEHIQRVKKMFPLMRLTDDTYKFCRVGKIYDGGYVMVEDFGQSTVAYSFGISDDVSWDADMAARGLDIYMYDHTIEALPEENPKFHWKKLGITGIVQESQPELKTLTQLLIENGHTEEKNMILKMDVEGAEWEVLAGLDTSELKRFSQIVLEVHGLCQPNRVEMIENSLQTLNETHALVHIHGNNYTGYILHDGQCLPDTLECTYVLKERYPVQPATTFSPMLLDMRNYSNGADIMLGWWGRAE